MNRLLTFAILAAMPWLVHSQESASQKKPDTSGAETLDRVCGRFVQSQGERKQNDQGKTVEKNRSLARVHVELFRAKDDAANDPGDCCDGLTKLSEAHTGLTGEFQFKVDVSPGLYWLAFHPGDHNYTILIKYDPAAKQVTKKCSNILYVLEDSGEIYLLRKINSD